jgi:hydroxyethylthiazole kinase-like uncharacterized protein yjeF
MEETNAAKYCFNRTGLQAMDRRAVSEYGLPLAGLMELAGVAVARLSATLLPPGGSVVILTGSGHNGADGLVAARHLANWGYQPYVYLANAQSEYRDLAGGHLQAVQRMGIPLVTQSHWPAQTQLVIDALLGTGLSRPVTGTMAELITFANTLNIPRLAVDIPSGLDCDTGQALGVAIKAQWTVSFCGRKAGFNAPGAVVYTGTVVPVDIGMPTALLQEYNIGS